MAEVVQVSRLLDQRGLSSFHYNLIFSCVLLSLIDGYDCRIRCANGDSSPVNWARSSAQAWSEFFSAPLCSDGSATATATR